ncbi:MAG TPA: class I SAM-dependent methyltransferase [Vicinamibacterales bacterium]|jgi:2-polyprenyl-3-methyl-5-hydroxy-6-metoxy-1,4-benzoquinol methylase
MMTHDPSSSSKGRLPSDAARHVCPWWLGYALASPIRRLFESPERLLGPYVRPGMTIVEPGCAMGYFSVPMARMVGAEGRVVCVDLQQKMIDGLLRRARRAGVADRISARVCAGDDLGLATFRGAADLVVAIHMIHEVPDRQRLLQQLSDTLRPGGTLLVLEPRGHVPVDDFARTLAMAEQAGLKPTGASPSGRSRGAVLVKDGARSLDEAGSRVPQ